MRDPELAAALEHFRHLRDVRGFAAHAPESLVIERREGITGLREQLEGVLGSPHVYFGEIPAKTVAEWRVLLGQICAYEELLRHRLGEPIPWVRRAA